MCFRFNLIRIHPRHLNVCIFVNNDNAKPKSINNFSLKSQNQKALCKKTSITAFICRNSELLMEHIHLIMGNNRPEILEIVCFDEANAELKSFKHTSTTTEEKNKSKIAATNKIMWSCGRYFHGLYQDFRLFNDLRLVFCAHSGSYCSQFILNVLQTGELNTHNNW